MKKVSMLGATTLAGTLLFTGVGHQAYAAQTVNDSNVKDYAKKVIGSKYTRSGAVSIGGTAEDVTDESGVKDNGNYYKVIYHGEKDNGVFPAKVYKNGRVTGVDPLNINKEIVYAEGQNQNTENNQQTQATNSNATTQSNTQTQVLPKTGKEDVNDGLVTTIAAVLLAVGSLLTFKSFSKENK